MSTQPTVISNGDIQNTPIPVPVPSQEDFESPADAPAQSQGPSSYTPAYQQDALKGMTETGSTVQQGTTEDPNKAAEESANSAKGATAPDKNSVSIEDDRKSGEAIAEVKDSDPKNIVVLKPEEFQEADKVHEQEHIFQNTRNKAFLSGLPQPTNDPATRYNYGGIDGLENERAAGRSIANASVEQQAKIQQDWTRYQAYYTSLAQQGKFTPVEGAQYDRLKNAYGWAITQISKVPAEGKVGNTIDTSITPPGPPPAAASGVLTDIPANGRSAVAAKNYFNQR